MLCSNNKTIYMLVVYDKELDDRYDSDFSTSTVRILIPQLIWKFL